MKLSPLSTLYAKEDGRENIILFAPARSVTTIGEAEENNQLLQDLEASCVQILAHQFRFQEQAPRETALLFSNAINKDIDEDDGGDDDDDDAEDALLAVSSSTIEQDQQGVNVITSLNGTKRPASIIAVSPDRPAKVARRWSLSSSPSPSACLLPTADDPMDKLFLMSLDSLRDTGRINPVHVIVRRHVFEVRRTVNRGRIFFQCACCKHRPRSERAKLSTLAPQGVDSIYRAFVRFMMEHVSACRDIPWEIKNLDAKAKKVPNFGGSAAAAANRRSGIKQYWAYSARRMGLMDGSDGKSIIFHDPREDSDEEEAELISDDDETN